MAATLRKDLPQTAELVEGSGGFQLTSEQISWLAAVGVLSAIPGRPTLLQDLEVILDSVHQRESIVRLAKRCRHCILGLLYSAYLRLESRI